jgi:hypothetical protein
MGEIMKNRINEKGQALMIVLFCSVIALVFVMAILYMVTKGTQMSGVQKRYDSALDAANASVAISTQFLDNKAVTVDESMNPVNEHVFETTLSVIPAAGTCIEEKLRLPTTAWSNTCTTADRSLDPRENSDIQFVLLGNDLDYDVRAKIVDSRRGVTAEPPGTLQQGGVVNSEGALTPVELPYFYFTVEVSAIPKTHFLDPTKNVDLEEDARITYIYAD